MLKLSRRSLLAAAYQHAVPIYTSSPGDSSIGMNLALLELEGVKVHGRSGVRARVRAGDQLALL